MFCTACGVAIEPGVHFCPSCGAVHAAAGDGQTVAAVPQASPILPPSAYPQVPTQTYEAPRTSGKAIAGFILSFFCGPLGLIFSILGYQESRKSNGMVKGEGLALAGIIISSISICFGLLIALSK
jgi:hypothetical protein